jgi:hypothetical protein
MVRRDVPDPSIVGSFPEPLLQLREKYLLKFHS